MTAYNSAQLAVYCVLALPILYLIFRHGRNGILGYFYLFAFAGLRIIGAAMGLSTKSGEKPSTGAIVISNIGLSPLLLASVGILHEARVFRNPNLRSAFDLMLIGIYHFFAVGGIVLIAMGAANLNSDDPDVNRHEELTLLKIGIIILLICYILLVVWTLSSFGRGQAISDAPGYRGGTTLLRGVVFTLPFTLVRLIFSTISIYTQKLEWNPFFGKLGIRVGMSFLPELITILIFVVVGFATAKLKYVSDGSGSSSDVQAIIGFGQKRLDRHTRRR